MNPHQVTKDFERSIADYCGSRFAVAVTSCTAALLLACAWFKWKNGQQIVSCPKRTYVGVCHSIINAGHKIEFRDEEWLGSYRLDPLPVVDSARWLTSGFYEPGAFRCLSLHVAKTLGVDQGGVILHDDPNADRWLRRARFDGRSEGVAPREDTFDVPGWHCYLSPSVAAQALWKLSFLPKHNEPLPNDDYPDLSKAPLFKNR